jgi:hypothetical protein
MLKAEMIPGKISAGSIRLTVKHNDFIGNLTVAVRLVP